MSIITTMRRQKAVLWPLVGVNDFGKPCFGNPEQVDCRWDDGEEEYVRRDGTKSVSTATMYPDRFIKRGSVVWLGLLKDVIYLSDPKKNESAAEVMGTKRYPNIKNTEILYICNLEPTAWRAG